MKTLNKESQQEFKNTVWALDFETPVGSSTFFPFFLFLVQHRQK
jgi:hypothetical protein